MNILLIRPTHNSRFQVIPPLSLGYLSSSLKQNGYNNISLIDGSLYLFTPENAVEEIKKKTIPDVIGIQVYSGAHNWAKEFIEKLKNKYPGIITIAGGPHITALKDIALDYIKADYGITGEGEKPIVNFIRFLEGKISEPDLIDGLIYKKNGKWNFDPKKMGSWIMPMIYHSPTGNFFSQINILNIWKGLQCRQGGKNQRQF